MNLTTKSFQTIIVLSLIMGNALRAQVGINTANPDPSSILDISSSTKGLLLPRMTAQQRNTINAPATGLVVFDTYLNKFSGYDGTNWTQDVFGSTKWGISGNSGTDPNVDFLGTTNNQDLVIKTQNIQAMRIKNSGQIRLEGAESIPGPRLTVNRPNAGTGIPAVIAAVDNGPGSPYPVNFITENYASGNDPSYGRVFGNYAFARKTDSEKGISQGGMSYVYSYSGSTNMQNALLFYAGGAPSNEYDSSKDVMMLGDNKSVYIGYPSYMDNLRKYPQAKVNIAGGDVYISSMGSGVIMTSPSGNCYRATVDNNGTLATVLVQCP